MTRDQMINVIVMQLMLSKDIKDKEDSIELILRRGFRGLENFSDEELKHLTDGFDANSVQFLLMASDLVSLGRTEAAAA